MVHGAAGSTAFGIKKNMWSPAATGSAFDLAPTSLRSLEPYRDYLTIVSNTDARNAEAFLPPEIGADHFRTAAVFLTQAKPKQTQGSDVFAGTSFDQIYAQTSGQATPIPVDAVVHRERRSGRRLLVQLLVRVYRHDQLGVADRSAADDPRPARGVRSVVRRRRDAGSAPGAAQGRPQHSRLGHRVGERPQAEAGRGRPGAAGRLPGRRARDRAADPEGRGLEPGRRAARIAGRAGRRARLVRGSRQADVRSAGRGAGLGHDADFLLQVEPRRVEPRLRGRAARPARSTPDRITSIAKIASPTSRRSTPTTSASSRTCSRS